MAERGKGDNNYNVLGGKLEPCCFEPMTGFYRDGSCNTGSDDHGVHTVCVLVTDEFLEFSKAVGNDLSTPNPYFPGLKAGDKWCLCAARWQQAYEAGFAPKVLLNATHLRTLHFASLEALKEYAAD